MLRSIGIVSVIGAIVAGGLGSSIVQPGVPAPKPPAQPNPTPRQPTIPGRPQEPVPAQPSQPGQPQQPAPEQPNIPGQPQQPVPAQPGTPGQPQQPLPAQPGTPGQPQAPLPGQPGVVRPNGTRLENRRLFKLDADNLEGRLNETSARLVRLERQIAQTNQELLRRLGEARQLTGERKLDGIAEVLQGVLQEQARFQDHISQIRTAMMGEAPEDALAPGAPRPGETTQNPARRPSTLPAPAQPANPPPAKPNNPPR